MKLHITFQTKWEYFDLERCKIWTPYTYIYIGNKFFFFFFYFIYLFFARNVGNKLR